MNQRFEQMHRVARRFVKSYVQARAHLTKARILRSERNLQGDYAEWLATGQLGLTPADSAVQKGYDATDKRGRKYQIKSRIVKTVQQPTSFDFNGSGVGFDFLICVFFSNTFDLLAMIKVPRQMVKEYSSKNTGGDRFRWTKRSAADTRIEWVVEARRHQR